ncbi:RIIa domain-containing protein 1 [Takifugu flavidus]|uniref:RIIa domain-containing protein 1 n=1 Tax=Takifugu flavidus TaxID=433684 RepID=UPI00254451D1|nr:RIIa domain-containing protein 1 [Takifugu flavidus]
MTGKPKVDTGALTSEQQDKLRQFKIKTRIDNEKYLRSHPEVETMISGFLRDAFLKRPTDIRKFAADHFARTIPGVVADSQLDGNSEEK